MGPGPHNLLWLPGSDSSLILLIDKELITKMSIQPRTSEVVRRGLAHGVALSAGLAIFLSGSVAVMSAQSSQMQGDAASATITAAEPALNLKVSAADETSSSSSSSSSSSLSDEASVVTPDPLHLNAMQYGRQRYGRPRYRGGNTNADGSNKWMGYAGAGFAQPVGNTYKYFTPNYGIQIGFGRQFSKHFAVPIEFDLDTMGLTKQAISNESCIYTYTPPTSGTGFGSCDPNAADNDIDANAHVWSFSIDPRFTLFDSSKDGFGAYVLADVGFYHKVTNFTAPQQVEECNGFCEIFDVQGNFDHYTSNAPGFGGGLGITYKFSHFSNEAFYAEGRYVFMDNSQRYGYTVANLATTTYNGYDAFPANSNRTTYIPIKFGLRF
jgi:hypothetical protein